MIQYTKQSSFFKAFFVVIIFSASIGINAQEFPEEFHFLKEKYPESSFIRLIDEVNISVELEDGGLAIKQQFVEEDLFLDESATYGSKKSLDFSTFFELESVTATSYNFKKGKYRATEVKDFIEKDELENSFHDDTKSLNFIYPNLEEGSKTKLEYTEIVKNPRFLSPIFFGNFYPIKNKKVTLTADSNINFKFQEFNTKNYPIKFNKEEKRGKTIYTWEINDVDEIKYEAAVPTYKKILPHIVPIITSYKTKNDEVKVLGDVADLYNWYYSMVKDINTQPTDAKLAELVHSITKDCKTDLEKVREIYYWTQKNIKYIDFEYALGGFIPREANDVFNKKYGDCKDNSSILSEMLKVVGLKGNLTWIGTRTIPYSYSELPTPMVDNHMILSYRENDKTYFLDATGRYLPLEMPSSFIQGKEALIGDGEGKFTIEIVPVMLPKINSYLEKTSLVLDGNTLNGNAETTLSGYYKIDFYNQLEAYSTEKEIKEYYTRKLQKGSNKFLIDDFNEFNKFSYDDDFKITYGFNINNYAKELGDEIYINLNLDRQISHFKSDDDRKNDIEFKYKSYYFYENTLEIPKNYKVEYLPENFELSNDFFSCRISYTKNENTIKYIQELTMDFLTLTPEDQKIVNSAIKKIEKQYQETIFLKKSI